MPIRFPLSRGRYSPVRSAPTVTDFTSEEKAYTVTIEPSRRRMTGKDFFIDIALK
jgi:hypothetical protein